jgi:hypothetical protein
MFLAEDERRRKGRGQARRLTREEAEAADLVLPHSTESLEK